MKKIYAGLLMAATGMLALGSCSSEDNPWNGSGDAGRLSVAVASDGGVFRNTRSDDTKATIVPDASEFKIALSRTDGSFHQTWANQEAFNREESFPIGEYEVEAFFGDAEQEGFTAPYYHASERAVITAGETKNVSLTASLANCMVSIRYTDEFTANFGNYSAALRSEGHDYVVFAQNESRPAYMCPSAIDLNLTLTNAAGKQVTIQPAGFQAQPRRHYIVTIGVNGNVNNGNLSLDVRFEENVVAETVNVPLGEDLFEAPEPTVETKDFAAGDAMTAFENFEPQGDPRYEVFAFGGLKEVTLKIGGSASHTPAFGREVQLVNASDLVQSQLEAEGVKVFGLLRNPDKMGIVRLKDFLKKLPVGSYEISLQVKDAMTRVSEEVKFSVSISSIQITIQPVNAVEYSSTEVEIYYSTNAPDALAKTSFHMTVDDLAAQVVSTETLASAPSAGLPANLTHHYKVRLKAPRRLLLDNTPLNVYYGTDETPRAGIRLGLNFPKFTVQTDPFAEKVKFLIVPEDPSKLELIQHALIIIRGGKQVDTSRVRPLAGGIIEVKGLSPNTEYSDVQFALSNGTNPRTDIATFRTEQAIALSNGDFSQTQQTININPINIGGKFHATLFGSHQATSSILINEAIGWSSINAKTCYTGSSNKNTWYMVPSTYVEGGMAYIRSVGYNHNGRGLNDTGNAVNTTYYCTDHPADNELVKVAGELFLGEYSFDGSDHRSDGISFTSRPTCVTFKYRFTSVNNENAEVQAVVYDAEGIRISEGYLELGARAGMTEATLNLLDYPFGKKAAKLVLCFKSTDRKSSPKVNIPTGSALKEDGASLSDYKVAANKYKAVAIGSELVIDDVTLGYTPPSERQQSAAKRKSHGKKR